MEDVLILIKALLTEDSLFASHGITNLIATIALCLTICGYCFHKKQERTATLVKYNERYSSDSNIQKVVSYLLWMSDKEKQKELEASLIPTKNQVEMFMRFFEELQTSIDSKLIKKEDAKELFSYYAIQLYEYIQKNKENEVGKEVFPSKEEIETDWKRFKKFVTKYQKDDTTNILKSQMIVLLALCSLNAYAINTSVTRDQINYFLNSENKTASVESKSGGYTGDIVIPESVEYDGEAYPVTSIYKDAFKNCSGLTSLTIPNSVTSIGKNAFKNCSGLTSVTIGNGVTEIGDGAFAGCSKLTSVTLNNNNIVSGERERSSIIKGYFGIQIEKCILGEDVMSIGDWTFHGCSNLISVTIPNSVTSIGSDAFRRCSSLTSVNIPNSVTSIGSYAFWGCI